MPMFRTKISNPAATVDVNVETKVSTSAATPTEHFVVQPNWAVARWCFGKASAAAANTVL